jgi:hypothetical protein
MTMIQSVGSFKPAAEREILPALALSVLPITTSVRPKEVVWARLIVALAPAQRILSSLARWTDLFVPLLFNQVISFVNG